MGSKSKVIISSNNKGVVETFDNAFKYVESNKSPSTLYNNYFNLKNSMYKIRKSLKKKDKPVNLSISLSSDLEYFNANSILS